MAKRRQETEDLFNNDVGALGDLGMAFDFSGYKDDLTESVQIGAGIALANVAWAMFVAPFIPDLGHPAVKPAIKLAAGAFVGPFLSQYHRELGKGIGYGLTAGGLVGVVNAFGVLPQNVAQAAALGAVGQDDMLSLSGAPVEISPLEGAPIEIQALGGTGHLDS